MQSLMAVVRWEFEILKLQDGWDVKSCVSDKLLSYIHTYEIGYLDLETEMLEQKIYQTLGGER